jgi:pyrroline-5-carboxylate reductase
VTTIGILGTGGLAELMVRGLQGSGYRLVLSPRGAATAARLASEYGCEIAPSNQAVVDAAAGVFVSLPAASGVEELARLAFRPSQPVLSAMAGTSLSGLQSVIGPAVAAISMMPGYANAYRVGPSILYPDDGFWQDFLSKVGPVFTFPDEAQFTTAACFGAFSGASIGWMAHVIGWFESQGVAPDTARALVAATLRGNAEVLLHEGRHLDDITRSVVTPGGISEMVLKSLFKSDGMTAWDDGLAAVLRRIKG